MQSDWEGKRAEILARIRSRSPFAKKRTEAIVAKQFGVVPKAVKLLDREYEFSNKRVLDVGCGWGNTLLYWGKGSAGMEMQGKMAEWLVALGVRAYRCNVEDSMRGRVKRKFEAVFCNNLIEHLLAPHLFLVRLGELIEAGGLLALGHPVVPPAGWGWVWEKVFGFRGWMAVEHTNFFTPKTIRLTLEKAGYEVIGQYNPGLADPEWLKRWQSVGVSLGADVISVCRKRKLVYDKKRAVEFEPSFAHDLRKYH